MDSSISPVAKSTIILASWAGSRGRLGCLGITEPITIYGERREAVNGAHFQTDPLPHFLFEWLAKRQWRRLKEELLIGGAGRDPKTGFQVAMGAKRDAAIH